MRTQTFGLIFGLFTLAVNAFVVIVFVLWLVSRGKNDDSPRRCAGGSRPRGSVVRLGVALVTMLGASDYSELAHFPPCTLCWYQRIAIYPMSIVLLVAAIRRDPGVRWYAIPPLLAGIAVSVYHVQLEWFPHQTELFCQVDNPCTTVWVRVFGFVTLPYMALSASVAMIVLLLLAARCPRTSRSLGRALRASSRAVGGDGPAPEAAILPLPRPAPSTTVARMSE